MSILPKITIVDEHLPAVDTGTALTGIVETISEEPACVDDWNIHLLVIGSERGVYASIEHPERDVADQLDPQWLPIIAEQVAMDIIVTGFVFALQVPLIPGARCAIGLGFLPSGQSWAYTTINGQPFPLPIVHPQMMADCEQVAKRLWGPSWEMACVGHDHDHDHD